MLRNLAWAVGKLFWRVTASIAICDLIGSLHWGNVDPGQVGFISGGILAGMVTILIGKFLYDTCLDTSRMW